MGVKGHGGGLRPAFVSALTGPSQERAGPRWTPSKKPSAITRPFKWCSPKKLFSVANRLSHSRPSIKNAPDWL